MSTMMKRAGGATPSRRSAVASPPLRMLEVDQPRWRCHRLRRRLRSVVGQVGGERLALVVGGVEDHAVGGGGLGHGVSYPWVVRPSGVVMTLPSRCRSIAPTLVTPSEPWKSRGAVRSREIVGLICEVDRVRAAVVGQRRRQLVGGGRVARAFDAAGGRTGRPRPGRGRCADPGRARSVEADQPHPRRGPGHRRLQGAAPAGVENRRAGRADVDEDVGLGRQKLLRQEAVQPARTRPSGAPGFPAGSRGRPARGSRR